MPKYPFRGFRSTKGNLFTFRQFGNFDYSQGYGGDPQYMAPPPAPYNPTIMTPDQSAYVSKEGTGDNFEDEPPLMEGTVKPRKFLKF